MKHRVLGWSCLKQQTQLPNRRPDPLANYFRNKNTRVSIRFRLLTHSGVTYQRHNSSSKTMIFNSRDKYRTSYRYKRETLADWCSNLDCPCNPTWNLILTVPIKSRSVDVRRALHFETWRDSLQICHQLVVHTLYLLMQTVWQTQAILALSFV